MEVERDSEEEAFVVEDVSEIIKQVRLPARPAGPRQRSQGTLRPLAQAIETVLMPCTYQHTKVPQWTNNVRPPQPGRLRPASSCCSRGSYCRGSRYGASHQCRPGAAAPAAAPAAAAAAP